MKYIKSSMGLFYLPGCNTHTVLSIQNDKCVLQNVVLITVGKIIINQCNQSRHLWKWRHKLTYSVMSKTRAKHTPTATPTITKYLFVFILVKNDEIMTTSMFKN